MDAAIAFCIFNRPDLTARVFAAIRDWRPERLLVISDGPRAGIQGEAERVAACRAIVERIDWPCAVERNYAAANLGCRLRMASGLDWAFARAESLMVLEDDCLPGPRFFPYMRELLARFADDPRVMMISGDCFLPGRAGGPSYRFSHWAHIWGWASWRRAWQHFDLAISTWPEVRSLGGLESICEGDGAAAHWKQVFDQVHAGAIDTWDYSWQYACWVHQGLVIHPTSNLVSNLGFRSDATHTRDPGSRLANLPNDGARELIHPRLVVRDRLADLWTWENVFAQPPMPASHRTTGKRSWRWPRVLSQRSA